MGKAKRKLELAFKAEALWLTKSISGKDPGFVFAYQDDGDQLRALRYPGAGESFRLQRIRSTFGQQTYVDQSYTYPQQGDGRISAITDWNDGALPALSNDVEYGYDGLGRLDGATWGSTAVTDETLVYNAIGNMTNKNGAMTYSTTARPHQVESHVSSGYAFDANGNQSGAVEPAGTRIYSFNKLDQLTQIQFSNGTLNGTLQYAYDHSGARVQKIRPDGTKIRYFNRYAESRDGLLIKYYWAGDRLIARKQIADPRFSEAPPASPQIETPPWLPPALLVVFGGLMLLIIATPGRREVRVGILVGPARAAGTAVLVLLPSIPLLLAPQCGGTQATTIHYHLDHLGSTLAWTNGSGVLVRQIRYTSYGEVRGRWAAGGGVLAPTDNDRFEWAGHETEHLEVTSWPALGLVYMGARWYDARLGQFLSLDPARQYASPFAYGGWDPVNRTDPDGQFAWFAPLLAGIVISLIGAALDSTGHANVSVEGGASVSFGGGRSAGGSNSNQSAGWLLSANSLSTVRTLSQVRLIYAMAEEAGAFESPAHAPTTFGNVVSMALGLAEGGMTSDSGAERGHSGGKNPLTDVVVTKGSRESYSTSLDAFRSSHLEISAQPTRRLELGEFFTEVVRLGNGRFGYSPLRYYECTDNGCNGKWPDSIPNRWGLVHSHPNTDYPSTTDRETTRRLRIPGGLVTAFRDLRFYYQDNSGTALPLWSNQP